MSDRTDALESLLMSEGWRLFIDHVRNEWSAAGYGKKVKQAITEARTANKDAAVAVETVDYANERIGEIVSWPSQELARLKRQEAAAEEVEPGLYRSTTSASVLTQMSRRGSL